MTIAAKAGKIRQFRDLDALIGGDAKEARGMVEGEDVVLLQKALQRFGYLKAGKYKTGAYCPCTRTAVRRFQRFHGLEVDGVAGPVTKTEIMRPRCGLPDELTESASFVLRGCKYETTSLTFAFENDGLDVTAGTAREIVRAAFQKWSAVSPLSFSEVHPMENPTFRIAWRSGEHGDGSSFDGVGNVIAHAFFPPPCGGPHAGALHFDEDELFTESTQGGIHLGAVALHEIGHLLGLSHSDVTSAIMFPTYSSSRLDLVADDVAGIQALYGSPRLRFRASAAGTLNGTNAEARHVIELPANASIRLDGPNGADFDLYVKRGAPPTQTSFDLRAWTTSADEALHLAPPTAGIYHILVRSYSGAGNYTLDVELD